ncbi:hypothetical protein CLV62_11030 [Dysgonomonas alginatilytica]|uniref:Uncharacterized protein n=1 Tax=Dysgonomonas alginatilytica TaxID=1605892 RepID=A0A2V3PNM2_9BACT|nr:hypothetical protein CLV62_11030 [Dysgonomonas alginatilytica]
MLMANPYHLINKWYLMVDYSFIFIETIDKFEISL